MESYPVPETQEMVAVCAPLLATGRKIPPEMWTRHYHVRTERHPDSRFGMLRPEYRHVYRCSVTGADRQLGVEGDSTPDSTEGAS